MDDRVLHVLKTSGIGGAERHLLTLLPGLAARGAELRVLVATTEDAWRFVNPLASAGIDVRTTPAGPDLNPFLYRQITKEIREFRPGLLHTHLIHGDVHGQMAAARAGIPAVSSLHSAHDFYRRLPYRPVCRYVSEKASRTIAISRFVRDFAEELRLNAPDAIRVVHYGISISEWDAGLLDRELSRRRHGLEDEEVAFGVASRLIPGKGHSLLIEAFAEAVERVPRARLLIAGQGPLRPELEAMAEGRERERIRFLGFVEDVKSFLCACDVLVVPTLPELGEGFGLAALEGMATRRPVIATHVGALPEVVLDEETGIVVGPEGPSELASAIERLASSGEERAAMGEGGRRRAEECFSETRMVERTLRVYGEVGDQPPPAARFGAAAFASPTSFV